MSNDLNAHHWKSEQLFFKGDDYFNAVLESIQSARREILVESYIFNLDPIGKKILNALGSAKARGVEVRILVDGIGSYNWLPQLRAAATEVKIPFRVYHPLPFSLAHFRRISWRRLKNWIFWFRRMNKRNHRKFLIIDSDTAFLGSYNISQVHSEEYMGEQAWRDTGVRVSGAAVGFLRRAFLQTWGRSRFDNQIDAPQFKKARVRNYPHALIRLNSTIRWRFLLLRDLKRRMRHAESRILITNAYFLPRKAVLRGIRKAARRGIYVALCLPAKTDVPIVRAATQSLYLRLIKDGVHIFEYQPRVLHAKTLIIDNWATVGSHNLNHRSISHDLEAEAVVTSLQNINTLLDRWDKDVSESKTITLDDFEKFGFWRRLYSRVAYWFRYWL